MSDFVTDAQFRLVSAKSICDDEKARVHRGFYNQYKTIEKQVGFAVTHTSLKLITFVGHSLGGALATLCSMCAKTKNPDKIVRCVTFGSPRVGNKAFADLFDRRIDKSIRCVNGQDIVTTRPYWGYTHVHGLLTVGEPFTMWKYYGSVKDHRTDEYENEVSKYEQNTKMTL